MQKNKIKNLIQKLALTGFFVSAIFGFWSVNLSTNGALTTPIALAGVPVITVATLNDIAYTPDMVLTTTTSPETVTLAFDTNETAQCAADLDPDTSDGQIDPGFALSHTFQTDLAQGQSYTVYVSCTSESTSEVNTGSGTFSIADTIAPIISGLKITHGGSEVTYVDDVVFYLDSYPGSLNIEFTTDESAYCSVATGAGWHSSGWSTSFSFDYLNQAPGYYQKVLYCRDSANNETVHRTLSYTLDDTTPPVLSGVTVNGLNANEYYDENQSGNGMKFYVFNLASGTTEATVALNTDVNSFCWYSTNIYDTNNLNNNNGTGHWFQSEVDSNFAGAQSHSTTISGLSNGSFDEYYVVCYKESAQDGNYIPTAKSETLDLFISVVNDVPAITVTSFNNVSYTEGVVIPDAATVVFKAYVHNYSGPCYASYTENFDFFDFANNIEFASAGNHYYTANLTGLSQGSHTVYAKCSSTGGYSNEVAATFVLGSLSTVSTPVPSVPAGTYISSQSVALSSATANATIHYTTNGSTPDENSTQYSGAISISSTTTLKAIAIKAGMADSAVMSAVYTIDPNASVNGACGSANGTAVLTAPVLNLCSAGTQSSPSGSGPWTWTCTGLNGGTTASCSASFAGAGQVATPIPSLPAGTYTFARSVALHSATEGASIYYTTNGTTPTSSSTLYTSSIYVLTNKTIKAIATKSGMANSNIMSASYVIDPDSEIDDDDDDSDSNGNNAGANSGDGHDGYTKYHKKYIFYRGIYRNEISKGIYLDVKAVKRSNPKLFAQWKAIFLAHKHDSKEELSKLDVKTNTIFWKYKNYNGYRNYKIYKIKNDDTNKPQI